MGTIKSFTHLNRSPTAVLLSVSFVANLVKNFHWFIVLVTSFPFNHSVPPEGFSALKNLHDVVTVLARFPLFHESHLAVVLVQTLRSEEASERGLFKVNQLHVLGRVVVEEAAAIPGLHPVATELQRKHGAGCVLQACGLRSAASALDATALPFSTSWGRAGSFFARVVHSEALEDTKVGLCNIILYSSQREIKVVVRPHT